MCHNYSQDSQETPIWQHLPLSNEQLNGEYAILTREIHLSIMEDARMGIEYEEASEAMERALEALEAEYGPDNDNDLDPEAHGDYSFEIQSLKDAGRGHLT